MSTRRYPTAELYEERQRDFYGNGNRSERSYDELDIDIQRGTPRRSAPDFLRDDYGRGSAGPLVVRDRQVEESSRPRRREVEEDTLVIRGGRREERPRERVFERDDITIRRGEREPERARPREVDETDITIKHRDSSRPRAKSVREVEREDITFRRGGGRRESEVDRDDFTFRRAATEGGEEKFSYRREESRNGREREVERDSIVIRNREKSLPPPRGELVAREREEFVVRRRREPSPPREEIKDEIIIRRMEQRSPSPPPPPPPPPEPEPIIRPPIIQEVITHHRHIDHGVERARSPTPPPPPPSPPREEKLEIEVRSNRRGREDIFIQETFDSHRSHSAPRRRDSRSKDMWTEITKDLVSKEAIEWMGHDYEETGEFFYVMEYLRYEDVLQLVELTDELRRKRNRRPAYEEDFYEREVSVDRRRRY